MKEVLGVSGGSGIYDIPGLTVVDERAVETPFGAPSDAVTRGRLGDTELLFLPRHGRGHRVAPHQINYRANVAAMKLSGATQLLSLSAVGSMKEAIAPGDVVVVDQLLDFTKRRVSTFFEDGIVAHVGFADPVCPLLAEAVAAASERAGGKVQRGGTLVVIEGPQFSTRAESLLYRSFGVDVIGMTGMPEAKLAREAELPFAILAMATDYDCWHETEEDVSVQSVLATLSQNAALAKRTLVELCRTLPDRAQSPATSALRDAIITQPDAIEPQTHERVEFLLAPYL